MDLPTQQRPHLPILHSTIITIPIPIPTHIPTCPPSPPTPSPPPPHPPHPIIPIIITTKPKPPHPSPKRPYPHQIHPHLLPPQPQPQQLHRHPNHPDSAQRPHDCNESTQEGHRRNSASERAGAEFPPLGGAEGADVGEAEGGEDSWEGEGETFQEIVVGLGWDRDGPDRDASRGLNRMEFVRRGGSGQVRIYVYIYMDKIISQLHKMKCKKKEG